MRSTYSKAKISLDFLKMDASGLATFGDGIVTALTGNADFPNPLDSLPVVTSQVNALRNTLTQIIAGNKSLALTRQVHEQAIALMMSITANRHYVETIANTLTAGDLTKAEQLVHATGYKLKKKSFAIRAISRWHKPESAGFTFA